MHEAISADLDGEGLPVARSVFHRHLAECGACRDHQVAAAALHRRARISAGPEVPDLTARVLAAIGAEEGGDEEEPGPAVSGLRLAIAALALVQLGLALPALLLGSDAGVPVHAARDMGSFGVALAVALLVAAWKPARVAGLLPLAAALVVCVVAGAVLNVATHHAAVSTELGHAPEVMGLVALWLLARARTDTSVRLHPA